MFCNIWTFYILNVFSINQLFIFLQLDLLTNIVNKWLIWKRLERKSILQNPSVQLKCNCKPTELSQLIWVPVVILHNSFPQFWDCLLHIILKWAHFYKKKKITEHWREKISFYDTLYIYSCIGTIFKQILAKTHKRENIISKCMHAFQ